MRPSARTKNRRLNCESLEKRQLMAADLHFGHNLRMPEDTDNSGMVSPVDALRVINALNARTDQSTDCIDVNADGKLTPADALTVINLLNKDLGRAPSEIVSGVDAPARIARIEAAIESGILPSGFDLKQAKEILTTLRAGGRPEVGETPVDGILCQDDDNSTETSSGEPKESHPTPTLDQALERISQKLTAVGVPQATIDQLVADVHTAVDAGGTDLREIIKTELDHLGIDLPALIEQHHGQEKIDHLAAELAEHGVEQAKVDQLVSAMTAALNAGTPFTKDQLIAKMTELGIDPAVLDGHKVPHPGGILDQPVDVAEVKAHLEKRGVDPAIITTIVTEIQTAADAGTPMTRAQLMARLVELGVLGKPDPKPVLAAVEHLVKHFHRR